MKCLSDEEIIRYLSIDDISKESMQLVSQVHAHERECQKCREKIEAFRAVYEKMGKLLKPVTDPSVIRYMIQVIHGVDKELAGTKKEENSTITANDDRGL